MLSKGTIKEKDPFNSARLYCYTEARGRCCRGGRPQHPPSSLCGQGTGLGFKDTPSTKNASWETQPPKCQVPAVSLHVSARLYQALRWDLRWEEPLDFPALLLNTPGKRSPGLVTHPAPLLSLNNGSLSSIAHWHSVSSVRPLGPAAAFSPGHRPTHPGCG